MTNSELYPIEYYWMGINDDPNNIQLVSHYSITV